MTPEKSTTETRRHGGFEGFVVPNGFGVVIVPAVRLPIENGKSEMINPFAGL